MLSLASNHLTATTAQAVANMLVSSPCGRIIQDLSLSSNALERDGVRSLLLAVGEVQSNGTPVSLKNLSLQWSITAPPSDVNELVAEARALAPGIVVRM